MVNEICSKWEGEDEGGNMIKDLKGVTVFYSTDKDTGGRLELKQIVLLVLRLMASLK